MRHLGRTSAISSGVRMSRRASSTNRPSRARHKRLASMNPSLVRLFNTTSTPSPPVALRICSPKSMVRLSKRCLTPNDFRYCLLGALAVANTSAPAACASWMAASPTPPAPAWMRTRSPGSNPEYRYESSADTNALGIVAECRR